MICSKCGKQIPENTNFCNFCGAQQTVTTAIASAKPQTADTKKSKKKSNVWIILVVALVIFFIGKFIATESLSSDDPTTTSSITTTLSETARTNPEYESIFSGTAIVHFKSFFNMETANFATKFDGGTIFCVDYGYKDDIVKEQVITLYVPIKDLSDSQKSDLITQTKEQYASFLSLDCCSVRYSESVYYFSITLEIKNVDKPEIYGELYEAGLQSVNAPISMSLTENSLITEGLIKK